MTLQYGNAIILFMKRMATQKNGFWKRLLINIPFVILIALMIALFGGGLLLAFYSIVSVIAFNSAMIYLIVAGASAILIGLGLILIPVYKKYYAFYNKKMGWKFAEENPKPEKTVTYDKTPAREMVKKYLTVSNVAIGILALGSIFTIISAGLGCIDRENWVRDIGGYREKRGYYTDVRNEPVKFNINGGFADEKVINNIIIEQADESGRNKEIVLVYTNLPTRQGFVEISGYKKFEGDFSASRKTNGVNDTVTVHVGDAPELNAPLDKLLFFIFDDYVAEKQIIIYIPYAERNNITVENPDQVLTEYADGKIEEYVEK